jgi:thiol-disulfide isomerase/thioredoxin
MIDLIYKLLNQPTIDGRVIDITNKVVLINFWDTRCGTCVAETPTLITVYNKFKDRGFEIIGVCLDEEKEIAEKYIQDNNIKWPNFFDGKSWNSQIIQDFGIFSIPTMLYLNRNGEVTDFSIEAKIMSLL